MRGESRRRQAALQHPPAAVIDVRIFMQPLYRRPPTHIAFLRAAQYLHGSSLNEETAMLDLIYLALGLGLFGLMQLYARWAAKA
jgi:hypothetical protein